MAAVVRKVGDDGEVEVIGYVPHLFLSGDPYVILFEPMPPIPISYFNSPDTTTTVHQNVFRVINTRVADGVGGWFNEQWAILIEENGPQTNQIAGFKPVLLEE